VDAKNEIGRHAADLENVVTERTAELRETIGELEGFSYSISHDMRAPLRAMQSFSQFLLDEYAGKLDERGVQYLHQIMRSSIRLDRLIQDVLSYTKLLHSPVPMEEVNLDRLVRDIIETYPNGQPLKPQIKIKGTLPNVMGNEALLTQCVANLLSNGAKFVSLGTTPHLEVSAEGRGPPLVREWKGAKLESSRDMSRMEAFADGRKTPLVRVWFKDNGIGIAPENHARVVRLFERIHPATEYEGTGIGLTIVRKAVERMGAQFGFDSALGKGSQFWIDLTKA
jgi:signal transduction histidine kinase